MILRDLLRQNGEVFGGDGEDGYSGDSKNDVPSKYYYPKEDWF